MNEVDGGLAKFGVFGCYICWMVSPVILSLNLAGQICVLVLLQVGQVTLISLSLSVVYFLMLPIVYFFLLFDVIYGCASAERDTCRAVRSAAILQGVLFCLPRCWVPRDGRVGRCAGRADMGQVP